MYHAPTHPPTQVRPGGLKADPPAGGLFVSGENTLNSGEISRDLVADVCVAALADPLERFSQSFRVIVNARDGDPLVANIFGERRVIMRNYALYFAVLNFGS